MKNASAEELVSFSKHLMVILLAVFAFVSSSLLSIPIFLIKLLYVISLLTALLSIWFGHKGIVSYVNFFLKNTFHISSDNKKQIIDNFTLLKIKNYIEWQYRFSFFSLFLIAITMSIFLFLPEDKGKTKLHYFKNSDKIENKIKSFKMLHKDTLNKVINIKQ